MIFLYSIFSKVGFWIHREATSDRVGLGIVQFFFNLIFLYQVNQEANKISSKHRSQNMKFSFAKL